MAMQWPSTRLLASSSCCAVGYVTSGARGQHPLVLSARVDLQLLAIGADLGLDGAAGDLQVATGLCCVGHRAVPSLAASCVVPSAGVFGFVVGLLMALGLAASAHGLLESCLTGAEAVREIGQRRVLIAALSPDPGHVLGQVAAPALDPGSLPVRGLVHVVVPAVHPVVVVGHRRCPAA